VIIYENDIAVGYNYPLLRLFYQLYDLANGGEKEKE
jgi:hypothetical protein